MRRHMITLTLQDLLLPVLLLCHLCSSSEMKASLAGAIDIGSSRSHHSTARISAATASDHVHGETKALSTVIHISEHGPDHQKRTYQLPAAGGRNYPIAAQSRGTVNDGEIYEGGRGLIGPDGSDIDINDVGSTRDHRKFLGFRNLQKAICRDLHSVPSGPNPISNYMPTSNLLSSNHP